MTMYNEEYFTNLRKLFPCGCPSHENLGFWLEDYIVQIYKKAWPEAEYFMIRDGYFYMYLQDVLDIHNAEPKYKWIKEKYRHFGVEMPERVRYHQGELLGQMSGYNV